MGFRDFESGQHLSLGEGRGVGGEGGEEGVVYFERDVEKSEIRRMFGADFRRDAK